MKEDYIWSLWNTDAIWKDELKFCVWYYYIYKPNSGVRDIWAPFL